MDGNEDMGNRLHIGFGRRFVCSSLSLSLVLLQLPSSRSKLTIAVRTTQTLDSSIMDYQYENGRRYHAYEAGSWCLLLPDISAADQNQGITCQMTRYTDQSEVHFIL